MVEPLGDARHYVATRKTDWTVFEMHTDFPDVWSPTASRRLVRRAKDAEDWLDTRCQDDGLTGHTHYVSNTIMRGEGIGQIDGSLPRDRPQGRPGVFVEVGIHRDLPRLAFEFKLRWL